LKILEKIRWEKDFPQAENVFGKPRNPQSLRFIGGIRIEDLMSSLPYIVPAQNLIEPKFYIFVPIKIK
jgi:hypothetical protein